MKSETKYGADAVLNVLSTRWGRRGALVLLLVGTVTIAAKSFSWFHFSSADRGDYQVIADWQSAPDSRGLMIAISPHWARQDLRALGKQLQNKFHNVDNVVVMIFDDAAAARLIRKGSRTVTEKQFQRALLHQRAMYMKSSSRGEDSLTIYKSYPVVGEVIRFNESDLRKTTG